MTAHLQGYQLKYLRWELTRLPAISLCDKLREAASRYDDDDPLSDELKSVTPEIIQEWERETNPIPTRVMGVILKALGFPKQFLTEGFIKYCRAEGLPRLSVLHLGRIAIKRGAFRGQADENAWQAIARTVIGSDFEKATQLRLLGEYQCQNCGYLDLERIYLICPDCSSSG